MDRLGRVLRLLWAVGVAAAAGCSASRAARQAPLPAVLPPTPSLAQVLEKVNYNAAQIRSFSTAEAELSSPGMPSLRGTTIVFERPRRLRLRAGTTITGPELDLGSNDELFWLWVRRNEPRALLFCRHAQYAASPARQMLPIDPDWLLDALGLVEFDPAAEHQGPFALGDGRLEIRSVRSTPEGPAMKIVRIQSLTAAVVEQHAYDARGQLVASALATQHRREPLSGLVVPRVVDIHVPRTQFSLRVDLGNLTINSTTPAPAEMWTMPSYEGWPLVDLCDPRLQLQPAAAVSGPASGQPCTPAVAPVNCPPAASGQWRPQS